MAESIRPHLNKIKIPSKEDKIYKDECAFCFDTPIGILKYSGIGGRGQQRKVLGDIGEFCFRGPSESENGLYISMCTNPFVGLGKKYVDFFSQRTGSTVFLHYRRIRHEDVSNEESEPQKKATRLAIGVPGGFDVGEKKYNYEHIYSVVVLPGWDEYPLSLPDLPDMVVLSANSIVAADSASKRAELEAMETTWEGDARVISKFSDDLLQLANGKSIPPSGWKCDKCDLTENLWLNLTDGAILCGRKNFDGSGGNNHAVEHYHQTSFPLAVKLGTITPEGGDVYSYAEDDMVLDPKLPQHLAHFGIDIMKLSKSDKTMAELELDMNQRTWEWSLLQESGHQLHLVNGPGLTGIYNLGNSCYMNSVMQVLFTLPPFVDRYYKPCQQIFEETQDDPNENFNVQMAKFSHGLLSGDYSSNSESQLSVNGIRPQTFRTLIGRNHHEFATKRQQDAQEYMLHVLGLIERNSRGSANPAQCLKFRVEDRIECMTSHKVKYTYRDEFILSLPVPLEAAVNKDAVAAYAAEKSRLEAEGKPTCELNVVRPIIPLAKCIATLAESSFVEDFYSSAINGRTTARKYFRLATFPDYLFLHMQKFTVGNDWVERKLDVSVDMPDVIDITALRGFGKQPDEEELPEKKESVPAINVDETQVSQLVDMGFPRNACVKAVYHTKNAGIELAMNWVMEHMDDADYDLPLNLAGGSSDEFMPDAGALEMIQGMGFTRHQATIALRATDNNLERALDWIFNHPDEINEPAAQSIPAAAVAATASTPQTQYTDGNGRYRLRAFISHMGSSTKAGHYVCHILKDDRWVIFNDEKVALSEQPPKDLGYIYLYERQ